jgi:hypothetical protein
MSSFTHIRPINIHKNFTNEHKGGETKKNHQFCGTLNFIQSLFPKHLHYSYIIASTYTIIIITFEPFALNVEFQHFILRFNKNSLLC